MENWAGIMKTCVE